MTGEKGMPWPNKCDVAFGVGSQSDFDLPTITMIDGIVTHPTLTIHADAFRESADLIVEGVRGDRRLYYRDAFFLPIAYLYRHAIELALKDSLHYALRLGLVKENDKCREVLDGHSLYGLWNILKPAILEFWQDTESISIEAAERIIAQFHELDQTGQAFRYPRRKDGSPSFDRVQKLPKAVDLLQLKRVAGGLCSFVNGCTSGFMDALSNPGFPIWKREH